VTKRVMASQ